MGGHGRMWSGFYRRHHCSDTSDSGIGADDFAARPFASRLRVAGLGKREMRAEDHELPGGVAEIAPSRYA